MTPADASLEFQVPASAELLATFAALSPAPRPWPRQFDARMTFADGSTETIRVLLDKPAPGAMRFPGALVSGPRMRDGAWSPSDRPCSSVTIKNADTGERVNVPVQNVRIESRRARR